MQPKQRMTTAATEKSVDGRCSIQAARVGALEASTWSTRSAASMNDVDTDEHRQTMAVEERP
jgi:hypothetical protein